MKNFISIFCCVLFFSCDNEIDINDEWADIPVIYGILNSGTQEDSDGSGFETPTIYEPSFLNAKLLDFNYDSNNEPDYNFNHFIRVQKSFLGEEAAYNYTEITDSIYYTNPNNLSVWIELVDPNYTGDVLPAQIELVPLNEKELNNLDIFKEDGLFNSENYFLYKIPTYSDAIEWGLLGNDFADVTDLCQGDCDNIYKDYKISVLNHLTGDTAFGITNIVQPLDMFRPRSTGTQSIFRLGLENTPINIEIEPAKNAKMYSVSLRFHYLEQSATDYNFDILQGNSLPTTGVEHKYIDWTLSDVVITDLDQLNGSGNRIKKTFYGAEFLTFLKSSISEENESDPEFYRYPINTFFQNNNNGIQAGIYHRCIDLNITAVNSELYTFLIANAPNYGFNQERPEYNNIENGIGHISSRSVLEMHNLRIDKEAGDSLSFGEITHKLNFACYSNLGTGSFIVNFPPYCE